MHLPMKMNCRLFLVGSLSESTFFNTRMFCSAHPNYEWDTHMHTCTHTRPGIKAGPLSSSASLWVAFLSPRFYLRVPFVGREEGGDDNIQRNYWWVHIWESQHFGKDTGKRATKWLKDLLRWPQQKVKATDSGNNLWVSNLPLILTSCLPLNIGYNLSVLQFLDLSPRDMLPSGNQALDRAMYVQYLGHLVTINIKSHYP